MGQYNRKRKLGISALILCFVVFYLFILAPGLFIHTSSGFDRFKEANSAPVTVYKTIYSSDDSNSLLGFELHSNCGISSSCGTSDLHKECSVIVRALDHKKDDYKTYCNDIVNDLVGIYGNKNITINIYDSFEAYSLVVDEGKLLTQDDEAYIRQHMIAEFDSNTDYEGDKYAYITYYPGADNELYQRVDYNNIITH